MLAILRSLDQNRAQRDYENLTHSTCTDRHAMASRKEQKDQARAARMAAERAAVERAKRNRKLQLFGILGVVAVVVIAAVVISSLSSSSSTTPPKTKAQEKPIEAAVDTLLAGIPQSGTVLGKPTAPVTLTYFGDLECPVCQDFTLNGGLPQLVSNDVRQGKVKVDYRSFCTATCNDHSQSLFNQQQVAAYAAGQQDLFWYYAELFYREQHAETSDYVNTSFLDNLAVQVPGLNYAKWRTDQGDPTLLAQVQADANAGTTDGVSGTPTLIATGPKGSQQVPQSVPSYGDLEQAIKDVQ